MYKKRFEKLNKIFFNLAVLSSLFVFMPNSAYSFEDCIIINKDKLTDISIEDNTVVNVYPLITIGNKKNTLFVSPLKAGKTRFCVLKNDKDIVMFNINITEEKTTIDEVKGFDIFTLDIPFDEFVLDLPPKLKEVD